MKPITQQTKQGIYQIYDLYMLKNKIYFDQKEKQLIRYKIQLNSV